MKKFLGFLIIFPFLRSFFFFKEEEDALQVSFLVKEEGERGRNRYRYQDFPSFIRVSLFEAFVGVELVRWGWGGRSQTWYKNAGVDGDWDNLAWTFYRFQSWLTEKKSVFFLLGLFPSRCAAITTVLNGSGRNPNIITTRFFSSFPTDCRESFLFTWRKNKKRPRVLTPLDINTNVVPSLEIQTPKEPSRWPDITWTDVIESTIAAQGGGGVMSYH